MDYNDIMLTPGRVLRERTINYHPKYKMMVGSVTASLLLNQINHWWDAMKERAFYKFSAPCKHELYKEGESWQEELGFTRSELEGAMKLIATKVSPGEAVKYRKIYISDINGKNVLAPVSRIVLYWKDKDNVTWYEVNEELQALHLINAYKRSKVVPECRIPAFANAGILHSNLYIDEQYKDEQEQKDSAPNFSKIENDVLEATPSKDEGVKQQAAPAGFTTTVEFSSSDDVKVDSQRKSKSPLCVLLEKKLGNALLKSNRDKLSRQVVVNYSRKDFAAPVEQKMMETHDSPDALYAETAFQVFAGEIVQTTLEWGKKNNVKGRALEGAIVKKLCSYGEAYGWLKWKESYHEGGVSASDWDEWRYNLNPDTPEPPQY